MAITANNNFRNSNRRVGLYVNSKQRKTKNVNINYRVIASRNFLRVSVFLFFLSSQTNEKNYACLSFE